MICTVPGIALAAVGIAVSPALIVAGLVLLAAGPILYQLYLRSQASSADTWYTCSSTIRRSCGRVAFYSF